MIYGERIKLAREFLGLSQTELAELCGVTQSTIAYIENGRFSPSDALIQSIASQTGFPLQFFERPVDIQTPMGSLLFRSRTSQALQSDKTRAYRFAQLAYEFANRLMTKVKPLPVKVPSLVDDSPSEAARITRAALGLPPDTPIRHLCNTLERAGVLVAVMPQRFRGIDGFSFWTGPNGDRPVIIVAPDLPADRLRLTLAHELGHLVLHSAVRGDISSVEDEAWEFAGEFMVPEESLKQELIPPVTLVALAHLKPRWGMSMQALIMRAAAVGIITPRQKTYLIKQMRARGWWLNEPGAEFVPEEKPRAIRQLAEINYGQSLNYFRIASDLGFPVPLVEHILSTCAGPSGTAEHRSVSRGKVVSFRPSLDDIR